MCLLKTLSIRAFTVRTVSIVAALIAGLMSFPAMGMFAYIAIAKYPQVAQITAIPVDIFTLTEVYTSPMTDWLIQRPYLSICILFHLQCLQYLPELPCIQ